MTKFYVSRAGTPELGMVEVECDFLTFEESGAISFWSKRDTGDQFIVAFAPGTWKKVNSEHHTDRVDAFEPSMPQP